METLISILISIILLLVGAGLGRWLRRLALKADFSRTEKLLIDTSLGLGCLSLVSFLLGIFQLYGKGHKYILIIPILLALPQIPGVLCDFGGIIARIVKNRPSLLSIFTGILLFALFAAVLFPALAPPSCSDWDSLAYHLSIPKLFIQHGGIYYIDFSSHSNFPFLMEMLYVFPLWFGSAVGAKLMHLWMGVLLIAAVAVLTRKHFNPKAAPLAVIACAGMPILLWEATTAYIDLATALYTVLSIHLLLDYLDERKRPYLIASAIAAGFAASTKMTALSLFALIPIWLFLQSSTRFSLRSLPWKRGLMFVGIAALVCSPWYIKSFVYTGNPVYPFFYSIFGGRGWNAALADQYSTLQAHFGMGHDIRKNFFYLPWDLAFNSEKFYDTKGLFIGPILLALVPLLFLLRNASKKLIGLTLFFLTQMLIWFMLSQQSRYLIPNFAIASVLIGAISYSDKRYRVTRSALMLCFVLTAFFGILTLYPQDQSTYSYVCGNETREQYLERTLGIYSAQEWINETLPGSVKVALYGDTRGFYLDRDYVWADPGHNTVFSVKIDSVDELIRCLHSRGVTHALVDYGISFPRRENASGIAKLIYQAIDQGRFQQVYPYDNIPVPAYVYEIK